MTEARREHRSSVARLMRLPAVFSLAEVEHSLGGDASKANEAARTLCHRWKQSGFISPLGPRNVGVYFNLVADRHAVQTRRAEAVGKLLRRPVVVVGGTALHAHGWTTQQHRTLQLGVPVTREVRSLPSLDHGIRLLPRSVRAFRKLADGALPGDEGFLVARPEMALADAILATARGTGERVDRAMGWTPTPDEIEPDTEEAWELVRTAMLQLGAGADEADELLGPYCGGLDPQNRTGGYSMKL